MSTSYVCCMHPGHMVAGKSSCHLSETSYVWQLSNTGPSLLPLSCGVVCHNVSNNHIFLVSTSGPPTRGKDRGRRFFPGPLAAKTTTDGWIISPEHRTARTCRRTVPTPREAVGWFSRWIYRGPGRRTTPKAGPRRWSFQKDSPRSADDSPPPPATADGVVACDAVLAALATWPAGSGLAMHAWRGDVYVPSPASSTYIYSPMSCVTVAGQYVRCPQHGNMADPSRVIASFAHGYASSTIRYRQLLRLHAC